MTGEITLKGDILKVGGIKEKVMACKKNKITTLYIPKSNQRDIEFLDKNLKEGIEFKYIENYIEIYNDLF